MRAFLLIGVIEFYLVVTNLSIVVSLVSNNWNLKVDSSFLNENLELWIKPRIVLKWKTSIIGFSSNEEIRIRQQIQQAFDHWSVYPNINFRETLDNNEVNFNLTFIAKSDEQNISLNEVKVIFMHTIEPFSANILLEINKDAYNINDSFFNNSNAIMKYYIGYTLGIEYLDDILLDHIDTTIVLPSDQTRFTRAITTATETDYEPTKSRMEKGRYVNSFNSKFKLPSLSVTLRWKFLARKNTRLPAKRKELDDILPVIRHSKSEDLYRTRHGIRFIWIGHASSYVQLNNFRFLLDPIFSNRCGIGSLIGPKRFRPPPLTVDDLPDNLDAVFISHNHFDHLDYTSVKSLNKRFSQQLTWFCGRGLRKWFLKHGVKNVIELDWWETHHFSEKNVSIAFCPAQHWSGRGLTDINKSLWGGFAIWDRKHKFYFAGDTGYTHNISIFRQIGRKYGPFDLSAIPIGSYEPRWMMSPQHVSPAEAVQIHIDIRSKRSIGVHWGTWAFANEYFMEPKSKLSEAVENKQLDPSSFIVVKHGEVFDVL
ncbi:unnamed protein product [Adineta ricciae]|uniref:Metallo-beta-lactamase domain-containing protein n=1 Tax=Adineta ricciae TaxID=249248 RepID=A0A814Y7G1_ADIRI|nr:unnamed protein product [Adineta ricciae]CAF1225940.1 unnamed protein product [Adineta ricciae]